MTKEKIYSEVYAVLQMLGNKYIEKVPHGLMEIIETRRDITYNPKYISSEELEDQGISRDSLTMIALIHLNYWCDSEVEKSELKKVLLVENFLSEEEIEEAKGKASIKEETEINREEKIREELNREIEEKIKQKRKERSFLSKMKKKLHKN